MLRFLKQYLKHVRRNNEANKRGWASVGKMLSHGRSWDGDKWRKEVRRSNRFYRLAHGKSPWKKFNGF